MRAELNLKMLELRVMKEDLNYFRHRTSLNGSREKGVVLGK